MDRCLRFSWQLLLLAMGTVGSSLAAEPSQEETSRLRLHGFGTLGVVRADTDFDGRFVREVSQAPGLTGLQSRPDSRLGVQANFELTPQFELVGQAVVKKRPAQGSDTDAIEWAFAAYRPQPDLTVRAGRMGGDLYLLSDYRNVGFAYTAARPNVDFYGSLSMGNVDGVDITKSWNVGDALWKAKAYAGVSTYDILAEHSRFTNIRGVMLSREADGLTLRGTLAKGTLDFPSNSSDVARQTFSRIAQSVPIPSVAAQANQLADAFNFHNIHVTYGAVGLAYEQAEWVVNAEVMRIRSGNMVASGHGGYALLGRRIGNLTPYIGYSRMASNSAALVAPNWGQDLAPLTPIIGASAVQEIHQGAQAATVLLNSYRLDQHTHTVGVRWDFGARKSLKVQWDRVTVRPNGGLMWGGKPTGGKANVGSVVLDFVF